MLAYIVAGLVMGALAWQLKHDAGDPRPSTQMIVGVGGAIVGGVATNLATGNAVMHMGVWGFAAAVLVAVIALAVLQIRVG